MNTYLLLLNLERKKIGNTNLLYFYVSQINTNKMVSKYLKNINRDLNFEKHIDLVIEYLEQFSFDFSAKIKSVYDKKLNDTIINKDVIN